jgi:hypothetical protein
MLFFLSKAYHEFVGFIMALNNAVKGKAMQCDYVRSEVLAMCWSLEQKGAFNFKYSIYCFRILYVVYRYLL